MKRFLVILSILFAPFISYAAAYPTAVGGTGTTTPSGILYGDNGATSHLNTVKIGSNCTFSSGIFNCSGGSGKIATSSSETVTYIPFWTSTASTPATLSGGSSAFTFNNTAGRLNVTYASTTAISAINSAYFATSGGNVGIGTTSPWAELSVQAKNGSTNKTLFAIGSSTASATTTLFKIDNTGRATFSNSITVQGTAGIATSTFATGISVGTGYSPYPEYTFNSDTNSGLDSSGPDIMNLVNGGINTMTLTSTNRVGIASSSPLSMLTIQGKSTYNLLNIAKSTGTSALTVSGSGFGTTTLTGLVINGSATSTSNVGINLTSGCYAVNGTCLTQSTGTVTSVAETVPSFLSISGSPITTSGTLAVSYSGTALPIANGGTDATSFGTTNGLTAYNGTSLVNYAGYTLSSTLFSATNATTTQITSGGTHFYVAPSGEITGYDTTHSYTGRISPTKNWQMGLATSTSWIGTTTSPYNLNAQMVLPFTGTLKQAVCNTNAGTVTGEISIGAVNYYITGISATPATTTLNAALAEGEKISFNAGNPASSPSSVSCTMYGVATP